MKSEILKKILVYTIASTAKFYYRIRFFGNFPETLGISGSLENCENFIKLHPVVCGNDCINFLLKAGFWQIGVLTKYHYCNASKCPQMPQKWVNTIPFGSHHTLDTLNHGLESLFYCFITHFGAGGSLDPPGAPWRPPGPPGAPLTPGMSSWAIVSHPGSSWVIFDPSGVNNWGVYTTVHCTALWCTVVHFGG